MQHSTIESQEVNLEPEPQGLVDNMKTSVHLVRRWQFVNKLVRSTHTSAMRERLKNQSRKDLFMPVPRARPAKLTIIQ